MSYRKSPVRLLRYIVGSSTPRISPPVTSELLPPVKNRSPDHTRPRLSRNSGFVSPARNRSSVRGRCPMRGRTGGAAVATESFPDATSGLSARKAGTNDRTAPTATTTAVTTKAGNSTLRRLCPAGGSALLISSTACAGGVEANGDIVRGTNRGVYPPFASLISTAWPAPSPA